MKIIKKLYYFLHKLVSKPEERGEYSAGIWQEAVRDTVFGFCQSKSGNMLEVGCGEGLFLEKIAKTTNNFKVFGIDIWQDILTRAEKRFQDSNIQGITLSQADAANLPFEDRSFDVVVCINVLFNLPSEEKVQDCLKDISRVMKKGGELFFDIRNSANPLLYFKYKLARYYDETVRDLPLRTYKIKKIKEYLQNNNFEFISKMNIGFPYNGLSPIFVIKTKRK